MDRTDTGRDHGQTDWTAAKIVAALHRRRADGLELNAGAVQKSDHCLAGAILRHFPSHDAALQAAGFDPATIRQRTSWDPARIVVLLRQRRGAGLELTATEIANSDPSLSGAIRRHFASHQAALVAAGLDPAGARKRLSWDKEKVIAALRDRVARGLGVSFGAVAASDIKLRGAIQTHFGSHDEALRAAGIDPAPLRQKPPPDPAPVVAALQARRGQGLPMNHKAVRQSDPKLAAAIRYRFKSYDLALRAAGIDPSTVRIQQVWDRQRIIAMILGRRARGLDLHAYGIEKSDPPLAAAIRQHFESHDEALRQAGIDPATVRRRQPWDEKKVIAALRDRQEKGLELNVRAIADEPKLAGGIHRHFGSHAAALQAAGIDPESVRKSISWDKPKIIAALIRRRDEGLELNVKAIANSQPSLAGAMYRFFHSHDDALRAAGIDPDVVRKRASWDRDSVIIALRQRADAGLDLNVAAVRRSDYALLGAVHRYFDDYPAALLAAGIDPKLVVKRREWDKETVVAALRERHAAGLALNDKAIQKSDPGLSSAARNYFGSHDDALRAAGFDPDAIRKARSWDEASVITALRELAPDGVLSPGRARSAGGVRTAAKRLFGSLNAAAEAAGIRYQPSRLAGGSTGHWNEEVILKTLQRMHQDGEDLRYRHMKERSQSLFFAAKKFFGSYVNAVRQAGINYWNMSQAQLAKKRAAAGATQDRVE